MESLHASLSRITPISTARVSVLPEDEIDDDDPIETEVHEKAYHPDNEVEDKEEDDSTVPEVDDNCGGAYILSKITEDNQQEMLEQNRMLLKHLFD